MKKCYTMDQAMVEAERCLLCFDAPCSKSCPAGTKPDEFIRKLRFRNLKGAVATIKRNNILGGVCAVVCPTCSLCEQECSAAGIGSPIRIGDIQRFLVEYGWDTGFDPVPRSPSNGANVAIVGAGPSGLTCAAELARNGCNAVVFEKLSLAGGLLRHAIPDHRLSREFLDREIADILALGVEIKLNTPVNTQDQIEELFAKGFEAVYVATGAWKSRALGVQNRDSEHVIDAMAFLRLAKEDPAHFSELVSNKEIVVVGGGDTAIDAAVTARKHGAGEVSVIYRRSFLQMPGTLGEQEHAIQEGIHFILLTEPIDYVIEDGKVRGLKVIRNRLGEPDASCRRRPVPMMGSEHAIEADLIVEAVGFMPDDSIRKLSNLKFDTLNHIVVSDSNGSTGVRNIFAGGDAVRGSSIVVRSVADGKKAASTILKLLALPEQKDTR